MSTGRDFFGEEQNHHQYKTSTQKGSKRKKEKSYNPFIASGECDKEDLIEKIDFSLALELSDANLALDLLPISDQGLLHILENILQKGMPKVAKKILYPNKCDNDDKYITGQKELQ